MSRSEAQIVVDCDRCGRAEITLELDPDPECWDADVADRLLKHGWNLSEDGDDVCPDCTEKQQRKEAALWPPNQLLERRTS